MSFDSTFYARAMGSAAPIRALSRVTLAVPHTAEDGRVLPAGSTGTIVGTWARGAAYEIAFTRPVAAPVTVEPTEVRATGEPKFRSDTMFPSGMR